MKRRGQMEVFGLVIIVVLASIFLIFAVVNSTGDNDNTRRQFSEESFADGFVAVLSKTYVESCGDDYTSIVRECANSGGMTCDGKTSCEVANETAYYLLNETVEKWGEDYRFTITARESDVIDPIEADCGDDDEKEAPGIQIIPLYPRDGSARVMLEICV